MNKLTKQGFTLVEILLVMGIMGILITILTQVFGSIITLRFKSEATSALAQDSRYIISRLAYDVARANSITSPSAGNSGNTLTLIISGQTYTYQLNSGALMLSIGGGAQSALTGVNTHLSSLTFTRYADLGGKKSINLDLIMNSNIIQPNITTQSRHLVTTLGTR